MSPAEAGKARVELGPFLGLPFRKVKDITREWWLGKLIRSQPGFGDKIQYAFAETHHYSSGSGIRLFGQEIEHGPYIDCSTSDLYYAGRVHPWGVEHPSLTQLGIRIQWFATRDVAVAWAQRLNQEPINGRWYRATLVNPIGGRYTGYNKKLGGKM